MRDFYDVPSDTKDFVGAKHDEVGREVLKLQIDVTIKALEALSKNLASFDAEEQKELFNLCAKIETKIEAKTEDNEKLYADFIDDGSNDLPDAPLEEEFEK